MSDFDKEFWDAVRAEAKGPVPLDQLESTIRKVLNDPANADWAKLGDNLDTTVLYSGSMQPRGTPPDLQAGATAVAEDLGARGNGTIGIINDTRTGQALGSMTDALNDGTLEAKYGEYVDFSKAPMDSAHYNKIMALDPNSMPEKQYTKLKAEAYKLSTPIYDGYKPSSEAFSAQIKGNIITVTPYADAGRDYRNHEIPNLVDRLDEGKITHVNGVPREEIMNQLGDLKGKARYDKAFETFNESFQAKMKSLDLDVYKGTRIVDGKSVAVNVLDVDQAKLEKLGAGSGAKIDPPNIENLKALDVTKAMAEPEKTRATDGPENTPDRNPPAPDPLEAKPIKYEPAISNSADDLEAARTRVLDADTKGELRGFAADPEGKTSYMVDTKTSSIYTLEEGRVSGVQKFDNSQDAGRAFGKMMSEAAETHPKAFKGLPEVHSSLGNLGNHLDELASPAWRKALGKFGGAAADVGGKASKILGPLGVGAAGYEVYTLEMKLQDYEEFGLVPEDAMLAYRAILTGHTAQATVDPTLLGGEIPVQLAHDEWARQYGISKDVQEALEPGSLLEDIDAAKQWLEAQAIAAGVSVKDYAKDRWNNPEKIADDLEAIKDGAVELGEAAWETAGDAAEAVGDYAGSRYDDPSLLVDDAKDIGNTIGDKATDAWNWITGNEEASELEKSLEPASNDQSSLDIGIEPTTATTPRVPLGDAVQMLSEDTKTLNADPNLSDFGESVRKAVNHPDASQMYRNLHNGGVEDVFAKIEPNMEADIRASTLLNSGAEASREAGIPLPEEQRALAAENETARTQELSYEDDYGLV